MGGNGICAPDTLTNGSKPYLSNPPVLFLLHAALGLLQSAHNTVVTLDRGGQKQFIAAGRASAPKQRPV